MQLLVVVALSLAVATLAAPAPEVTRHGFPLWGQMARQRRDPVNCETEGAPNNQCNPYTPDFDKAGDECFEGGKTDYMTCQMDKDVMICRDHRCTGCNDSTPDVISALTSGAISSCDEFYATVEVADKQGSEACAVDLGLFFGPSLKGKKLQDLCCDTCDAPTASPLPAECNANKNVCSQDIDIFFDECDKQCDSGDFVPGSDPDMTACRACAQEVFGGSEYMLCSCCIAPLMDQDDPGSLNPTDLKIIGEVFPCNQ